MDRNAHEVFERSAVLYLAALIVPLLLWVTYIYLSYWAIRTAMGDGCGPTTPVWLRDISFCESWAAVAVHRSDRADRHAVSRSRDPVERHMPAHRSQSNSLHRLYRDRLSRAFLFERAQHGTAQCGQRRRYLEVLDLKPRAQDDSGWSMAAAFAPYLLTNTAINLEGSQELNKRGRNADTFMFSPLCVGNRLTGYVTTTDMEAAVPGSQHWHGNGDVSGRRRRQIWGGRRSRC